MYPEFIAIYVLCVIIIAMLAFVIVLLLKNAKNNEYTPSNYVQQDYSQYYQEQPMQQQYQQQTYANVVYCSNCATEYDASQGFCPRCGTPRS